MDIQKFMSMSSGMVMVVLLAVVLAGLPVAGGTATTITVMHIWDADRTPLLDKVRDPFEAENLGIKVNLQLMIQNTANWEKLAVLLASGTAPDVVMMDNYSSLYFMLAQNRFTPLLTHNRYRRLMQLKLDDWNARNKR